MSTTVSMHTHILVHFLCTFLSAAYKCPNWLVTPYSCKTNTCSNTACRSPGLSILFFVPFCIGSVLMSLSTGTVNAIFIMESMMEHVARSLGLDVEQVKDNNLYKQGDTCYVVSYS